MKKNIPNLLLYSRLVIAFLIIIITFLPSFGSKEIILFLIYTGLITDVFDGILARKLNISKDNFRVTDTVFDLLFYLSILLYVISNNPAIFLDNKVLLFIILALEALMYLISLLKFGKLPSPHAILSKFWGIYIIIEFTLLIIGLPGNHFTIALIVGVFVHIDRVLIYIILNKWQHDIPSSYHALLIRQGKTINRIKLFNG